LPPLALGKELSRLGLSLPGEVEQKLAIYVEELERWNRSVNLTSLSGRDLCRRLVAEPCWIGQQLQMSGGLLDLGSGNGCPGIPLYISRGFDRVDLVEARLKRAAFLRHVASRLQAQSLFVHRLRIENMAAGPGPVQWITLQGVKPIPSLIGSLQRLFAATTRVVWITSSSSTPLPEAATLEVPDSSTLAQIVQLDQF
jgi:16S rRNA (guanine(527)-N(7))-methyltransferase RsmG